MDTDATPLVNGAAHPEPADELVLLESSAYRLLAQRQELDQKLARVNERMVAIHRERQTPAPAQTQTIPANPATTG